MTTIFKTSSIEEFRIYSNNFRCTYVYVPHQQYVIERKFLPNYNITIKSGWYRKKDIDKNLGVPINVKKCKPIIEEEKNVFINSYETHDENWVHFDNSNFITYMKAIDNHDWVYYEFMEDSENRITEIDIFDMGTIEIMTHTKDWIIVPKNILKKVIDDVANKVATAIEKYSFFKKTDNNEMIFFSTSLNEEFKI